MAWRQADVAGAALSSPLLEVGVEAKVCVEAGL